MITCVVFFSSVASMHYVNSISNKLDSKNEILCEVVQKKSKTMFTSVIFFVKYYLTLLVVVLCKNSIDKKMCTHSRT